MKKARHKREPRKGCRSRGKRRAFGSGAIFVMPKSNLSRKERRRRRKLSRWQAVGLAIGLTIGIGLFATLFLSVPKHSSADSVEDEDIARSTNNTGAYPRLVHE